MPRTAIPMTIDKAQEILKERGDVLKSLQIRISDRYRRFAEIVEPSVNQYYDIQEFQWDALPAAEFLQGEIEAIQTLIDQSEPNEGVIEFAISGNNKHPGYANGYYHGLVEVSLKEDDKDAKRIQREFAERPRYAQLVPKVRW
jgi:hypothetical protein